MSNTSPQRCLNRESAYQPLFSQISFIESFRLPQIVSILEKNLPLCQICKLKLKNHYCMETSCKNKKLLCIDCDIKSIQGGHYLHDFTYLVPLFSENVFQNFYRLKENFQIFHNCIQVQIEKVNKYLEKLLKIKQISQKQLENIQKHQKEGRYQEFSNDLKNYLKNFKHKANIYEKSDGKTAIQDIFKNVRFITEDQCQQEEQKMRKQLLGQIQKLNWLQNPQKILTQILKQNQSNMNVANNEEWNDIFVSSKKKISINQIDSFFRNYNQAFTQNLQYHKVEVKIDPELLNKSKFYEAFIYHFRQCQKLSIDNANITHLKTPLHFRKLKQLQFNCNVQTDSISNIRIDNQNQYLESFTIRKFREDDIKILKSITGPCKKLKNLHIEFFNKSDLSYSKELIEYLANQSQKDLSKFVLKIRTQNQVKRLYGYLSKFYRQSQDQGFSLSKTILEILNKNKNLTKVVIEGIKNLDSQQVLQALFRMKFLLEYRVYYENIDLMTELDNQMNRILQIKTQKRRRLFASLTKMSKDKHYPPQILHTIGEQFLV